MSNPAASLFRPLSVGKLQLPNRIAMAPMTRSFATGGVPSEASVGYYARRAAHDVGLIITEGTLIDRPSAGKDRKSVV